MFVVIHPAADNRQYTWSKAVKVLESLELSTRIPGHVAPVAGKPAITAPLVEAPVRRTWSLR